jgi:hypothetical protein
LPCGDAGKHRVEGGAVEPLATHHDARNPAAVGNIHERIGIEKHQVRCLTGGDRPELTVALEMARNI